MTQSFTDWIAPTGLRRVIQDAVATDIPDDAMSDPHLSLIAKGLYALLLTHQGQPIDPYEDAVEDAAEIRAAVGELIANGYAARVIH